MDQSTLLTTILTDNNGEEARIQERNKCFYGLEKLKITRFLSRDLKDKLLTILIRPVVTYEIETRVIQKTDESILFVFEEKTLEMFSNTCSAVQRMTEISGKTRNLNRYTKKSYTNIAETIRNKRL